jgi:hypothetical protein
LAGVGLVAVEWAKIELELKMHTSAMTAQETGGKPLADLEIGFKRLRKAWLRAVRKYRPSEAQKAERLICTLVDLSNQRALAVHGAWVPTETRGKYRFNVMRQNKGMDLNHGFASPKLLRNIANQIADAYTELLAFTHGKHSGKHTHAFLV